jgi:hypothetical protein
MARPHDIPDGSDEKWQYTEHAAAKHEILRRYLGAWLAILGRRRKGSTFRHPRLVLVDGFAGRGRYIDGQVGSPAIMFEQAVQAVEVALSQTRPISNILRMCARISSTIGLKSSPGSRHSVTWEPPSSNGPLNSVPLFRRS